MTLVTTGLTNGGLTTHYQIQYDDSLSQADGRDRANALIGACEADFTLMSGWFGNIALTVGTPITVNISPGGYASAGWGPPIRLTPGNGSSLTVVRYLLVSEVTEMFMMAQGSGWFAPDNSNEGSAGEGLSRFLASQFLIANGLGVSEPGFDLAGSWLNSTREDFVNHIDTGDHGIDAKTGCAILFIYYLFTQLGFTINQIIAAADSELSGVYRNLTGDSSDPFPFFKQLLDNAFPSQTSSAVPGLNPDNPFPLGMLSFWLDKSTFGRDEVHDVINSPTNGTFSDVFWLVLEGFNINTYNSFGVGNPVLSGPFKNLNQINIPLNGVGVEFEFPGNHLIPQRIRFPYDVHFTNLTLNDFPNPGDPPTQKVLNAVMNVGGHALPGASAITEFELVGGADPYFTNIDPAQNNVFWLSQDLRVFTATPGLNNTPVAGAPAFPSDSTAGAYTYVQNLLAFLNNPANHFTDGTNDPFASGLIPQQGTALTADSSVTPFTFSFAPFGLFHNYNFAIARVRLRGTAGPAGDAQNVKVFFRLWSTQTADTDFQPGSTYSSHQVGGKPEWPLPAPGSHTIPFFATGNSPNLSNASNPEYGTGGVNNKTLDIPSGDSVWAYFGCFLNVYDAGNIVNGSPVQALLNGTHHCLVAEIAYDDAPIINANGVTRSPENSDKLAQRNMQVTHSDNPGAAATHMIPQTFDLRPSQALIQGQGILLQYPDELMIDWGNTPLGSTASIYWPQVDATQVLDLASRLYASHSLTASDAHTIQCTVTRGVTYVPIPIGTGQNFASLFTVDLPSNVVKGQEFNIIVRRVSTRRARSVVGGPVEVEQPPPAVLLRRQDTPAPGTEASAPSTEAHGTESSQKPPIDKPIIGKHELNWRYVVGTFQVKIPVSTKDVILRDEENTLAIFKWRLQMMSPTNRWYPVLQRYLTYQSARVDGLGGNSVEIQPSPDGVLLKEKTPPTGPIEHSGKICEVIFDCFGDFEGFTLDTCSEAHTFKSREKAIGEIALRACKERLLVSVFVERGKEHKISRIVIRC